MQPYDKAYYDLLGAGARKSAQEIVPRVVELIAPRRVVDVGCGIGAWLSIFSDNGVSDILGVDGDYINPKQLQIPRHSFLAHDLSEPLTLPEQFDLVVSLEVAEHLPVESAATFIDTLVRLGPIILFSAAVPLQPGTAHLNPQWPNYWADIFIKRGFEVVDCLRKEFWRNDNVEYWYAQNMLIFVRADSIANYPKLQQARSSTSLSQLSIVHPSLLQLYGQLMEDRALRNQSTRELMSKLPRAIAKTIQNHSRTLQQKVVR